MPRKCHNPVYCLHDLKGVEVYERALEQRTRKKSFECVMTCSNLITGVDLTTEVAWKK